MLYKIAVLDDEENYADQIQEMITVYNTENLNEYKVKKYTNAFLFLDDFEKGILFDVYFLDIEMPLKSGMDIAKKIREASQALIVFVTGYKKYAIEGYKYEIFRYIHKSDLNKELNLVLRDLSKRLTLQVGKFLVVDTPKYKGKVYYKDIIYLYKEGKDTIFAMNGSDHTLKIRKSLEDVYKELSQDEFTYIDRCYIVNLQYIKGIDTKLRQLILSNELRLNISKSRIQCVRDAISLYWGRNL